MHSESKTELRKSMIKTRDELPEKVRNEKSKIICDKIISLGEYGFATTIAVYLSKGSEVDTSQLIKESLKLGKRILVPVTNSEIELVEFTSFKDLAPAKYGIPEPKSKKLGKFVPDLAITPGLAFDLDLHRLGYGKGYYDRLFKKIKTKKIGIAFDIQIVGKLPRHEHDQRMDIVISEDRILTV